ncbi:hypothetical protein AQUCO_01500448v1 [Aquilegia coerulea]|uniref:Methyltransferase type 11 domain-containing protein n=1 Tax=Aquilegia coerulea TaxID=218851 RepID=A0A2G5DTT3_AQUCA|nr:hypothetical protein AQUCO_01500448v1 [Aquilegia coerulea]PIA46923.1 hypothetical protein AQUCO_01500448v1 [Aquilegia coerulea]PIA46924.1 hypothetical protein AQUCO_01500448v1 [Aquilegia coerulea]
MMMMRTTSTTSITTSALHFRTCDTQSASASATATATSLLLPSFKPNNSKKKKKSNFVLLHQRSSRSSSSTRVGGRGGGGGAVTRASMSSSSLAEGGGAGGVLQKGIAEFYDESSGIWENIWGDHMHHGFYDPDAQASISDHRSAQIRMIEQSLSFAGLNNNNNEESLKIPRSIVDVGCGIGGSSRYLARKYGAKCQGITLSPIQAQRAQELANAQGLGENVSFQVADALQQPFPDGQFDLVWSMESGEHMPDKTKFVNELIRVASPGGTIIIVTWCHRDLSPPEDSLQPQEKELLKKICDAYYLPAWCSTADYVKLLQSLKMEDIKFADWSEYVAPFWPAVVRSALTWKGLTSLLRSGWKTIKGALAMPLMIEGYKKNLIKFSIITCRKPE